MNALLTTIASPFPSDVNLEGNRQDLMNVVNWMEDRKIRELEIDERDGLRTNDASWDSAFVDYLNTLGCPFAWPQNQTDCLFWLASLAVSAEYDDLSENIQPQFSDCDETELNEKLDILGEICAVPRAESTDAAGYLRIISGRLKLHLSEVSLAALRSARDRMVSDSDPASSGLTNYQLGFDTGDSTVNELLLVLKMLYLSDFRELQNDVNALIVLGQEFTANPRLNSSLGRVGR